MPRTATNADSDTASAASDTRRSDAPTGYAGGQQLQSMQAPPGSGASTPAERPAAPDLTGGIVDPILTPTEGSSPSARPLTTRGTDIPQSGEVAQGWYRLAPFPEPFEPKAAVAHFGAMAYAHHRAYGRGIVAAKTRDEVRELTARHFYPMTAAFTAAASMDESRDWTSSLVRDAITDGAGVDECCWQWLTSAGIDPSQIAAEADRG